MMHPVCCRLAYQRKRCSCSVQAARQTVSERGSEGEREEELQRGQSRSHGAEEDRRKAGSRSVAALTARRLTGTSSRMRHSSAGTGTSPRGVMFTE